MNLTQNQDIEINNQFEKALNLLENTDKNIFITGRAGTGKSTLLSYFKENTKKELVVLAPTGVAAVNIQGMTIHSFFNFKPNITLKEITKVHSKLYKAIDMIIIDEISMVRADLLDCVDKFLKINGKDKNKPFGGIQTVFIGDLYQLPPVVLGKEKEVFKTVYKSQYFFDAYVFKTLEMEFVELEKIYRQKDEKFINLLNAIRNKSVTQDEIEEINKRVNPNFEPDKNEFYINLTTTNKLSDEINEKELAKIKSQIYSFKGEIKGKFDQSYLPTKIELQLKASSQIMLLNNDKKKRWINGTIGKIINIEDKYGKPEIIIELSNGKNISLKKFTWEVSQVFYDKEKRSLDSEVIGSFTQFPVRLAWAVTIHKGQGKTFDNVIIDIGYGTFTHGQVYVALSRCTTLQGIVLKKPIQKKHIFMDWKIVNFLTQYQYNVSEKQLSFKEKIKMIEGAIKSQANLDIIYLKSSDVKSKRTIKPKFVGELEYNGKIFTGVEAYCLERQDDRVFRIDRILEMSLIEK